MAKKATKVLTKVTDSGIVVTLKGNTIIKKYSATYICMMAFSTTKEAKKEFGLFRQSHKH